MSVNPKIRDYVQETVHTFRRYESLHAAKGTLLGKSKARANAIMAERGKEVLALIDSMDD